MNNNSNIEIPNMGANANPMMPMENANPMTNSMQNSMPMMETFEIGGQSNGNMFKGFFNDINILDVMLSAFIVGGILYVVYYYKHQMAKDKTIYTDLENRLSTIEKQIKKVNSELNATGKYRKISVVRM